MGLVQILNESVAAASVIEQANGGPHLLDRIRVPAALLLYAAMQSSAASTMRCFGRSGFGGGAGG